MINAKFLFFASNSSRETFFVWDGVFCLPGENNGSGSFFAPLIHSVSCHVTLYSLRYFIRMLLLTHFRFLLGLQYFLQFRYFSGLVGFYAIDRLFWVTCTFLCLRRHYCSTQIVCTYGDFNASNEVVWSPFKYPDLPDDI